jgi:hypothetical protein
VILIVPPVGSQDLLDREFVGTSPRSGRLSSRSSKRAVKVFVASSWALPRLPTSSSMV